VKISKFNIDDNIIDVIALLMITTNKW